MYMDLGILLAGSFRYMKTNENLTQMLRNTNFETKAQSDPEAILTTMRSNVPLYVVLVPES